MTSPKTLPLYEIVTAYEEIGEALMESGGELTPELQQQWDDINEQFETKVENTALYIRNLDATAKALKVERERFAVRVRSVEVASKRLKEYLKLNMERAEIPVVKTLRVNARIQKNPKPAITWFRDIDNLPVQYRRVTVTVDLEAAHSRWAAVQELPVGFEVDDTKTHLRLT